MNFFEHQDRARKRTGRLVFLFGVAVILLVFAIYVVIAAAVIGSQSRSSGAAFDASAMDGVWLGGWFPWHPGLFLAVTVGTLAVIAGGSLYKTAALRSGGRRVAETLGGRLIPLDTVELDQRRVLNIVEEMALASGVPVPPVYLLPQERGINAFAAGFSPSDAVIGVTRGCIETLSRDELQGVVAHEFSHILNGDMRLNLRLIGLLHGILLIALIGSILMRSGYISRSSRSSNRKNANYLPLIGLVLYVLGYIGVFFGHLIKSSVSRQREFLADASAVQFTRNPEGIAGALARILQSTLGSKLETPKVEEASHLLFSNGLSASWMEAFSTHPPLPKRIQQIDPSFSISEYLKRRSAGAAGAKVGSGAAAARADVAGGRQRTASPQPAAAAMVAGLAEATSGTPQQPPSAPPPERTPQRPAASPADDVAEQFVQSLGQPTEAHLQQAATWRSRLPAALLDQLHTPAGAVAVTYCLFLDAHIEQREKQAAYLRQHALPGAVAEAQRWWPTVRPTLPDGRLGLVELALPALKQLSSQQYAALLQNLRSLVEMDRQVTVNEYALYTLIRLHLDRHFGRARPAGTRFMSVSSVREPAAVLLSILARAGQTPLAHGRQPTPAEQAAADQAYQRAWQRMLGSQSPPPLLAITECTSQRLDGALQQLQSASPAVKQRLLTACVTSVAADRQVTVSEAELLRLVADHLDCPAPPLLSLGGA